MVNIPPTEAVLVMRAQFKKIAPEFFLNPIDITNEYYKLLGPDIGNLVWLALTKFSDKDAEEMEPVWKKWLADMGKDAEEMFQNA